MIKLFSCDLVLRKKMKAPIILYTELQYIWIRHPSIVIVLNWEIVIRGRLISLSRGPIWYRLLEIKEIWKPIVGTDLFAVKMKLCVLFGEKFCKRMLQVAHCQISLFWAGCKITDTDNLKMQKILPENQSSPYKHIHSALLYLG